MTKGCITYPALRRTKISLGRCQSEGVVKMGEVTVGHLVGEEGSSWPCLAEGLAGMAASASGRLPA